MIYRAPLHVSGFWRPAIHSDPLRSGSIGAGVLLAPEISVESVVLEDLGRGETCYAYLNNRCIHIDPVERFATDFRELAKVSIYIDSPIPIGYGGALSAVSSLSYIHSALSTSAGSGDPSKLYSEASRYAHIYEVHSLTGLGDVAALTTGGGLVVRVRPGGPGVGEVMSIDPGEELLVFVLGFRGGYTTRDMLRGLMDRFKLYGERAFSSFIRDPSIDRFIEESQRFSRNVGFLTSDLEGLLKERLGSSIRRGEVAGYFVKKRLLLIFVYGRRDVGGVSGSILSVARDLDLDYLGIYRLTRKRFRVGRVEPHTRGSSEKGVSHT